MFKHNKRRIYSIFILMIITINLSLLSVNTWGAEQSFNYLDNNGFEKEGTDKNWFNGKSANGWNIWFASGSKNVEVSLDNTLFHEGTKAVKINHLSTNRTSITPQNNVNVNPYSSYKISMWIKTENVMGTGGAYFRYQYKRNNNTSYIPWNSEKIKGTMDWTYYEQIITIPENVKGLSLDIFLENAAGTMWVDDVRVEDYVVPIKTFKLNESLLSTAAGKSVQLYPVITPRSATYKKINWITSNESIATVNDDGVVKFIAPGKVDIFAVTEEGNFRSSCSVNVFKEATVNVKERNFTVRENSFFQGSFHASEKTGIKLSYYEYKSPQNGKVNISQDGKFKYYPNRDFDGTDSFTVMVSGKGVASDFASISFKVTHVNNTPIMGINWFSVNQNSKLTTSLVASDIDNDSMTFAIRNKPENGTASIDKSNRLVYTPKTDFIGYDSISVWVQDKNGAKSYGEAKIFIAPKADSIIQTIKDKNPQSQHPRLLATNNDFFQLKSLIGKDTFLTGQFNRMKKRSEDLLRTQPTPYLPKGSIKSSDISNNIAVIGVCGIMYRITGETKYAQRVVDEMDEMSAYPDWNAGINGNLEMSAMSRYFAYGYDWIYDYIDAAKRKFFRDVLLEKGIQEELKWLRGQTIMTADRGNNHNTVNCGSFGVAALAIADEEPEVAGEVINIVLKRVQTSLKYFSADGVWPEGPEYTNYGMMPFVEFLESINNTSGTDYGISELSILNNFADSNYMLNGPEGGFNFGDSSQDIIESPVTVWLANKFNKPGAARYIYDFINSVNPWNDNFSPMLMLFYKEGMFEEKPKELNMALKDAEIAAFHSSKDTQTGLYAAIKGSFNKLISHIDMDAGTFVYDAMGKRWASDLGIDNYNIKNYWNYVDKRWEVYSKKPEGHNTIVINPTDNPILQQDQYAHNKITYFSSGSSGGKVILDLTNSYAKDAISMKRGMRTFNTTQQLLLQDEIKLKKPSEIYWFMNTKANIDIDSGGSSAMLSIDEQRLWVKIVNNKDAKFSVMKSKQLSTSPDVEDQTDFSNRYKKLTIHMTNVYDTSLAVWMVPLKKGQRLPTVMPTITKLYDWNATAK